jgi:hypothetical protein
VASNHCYYFDLGTLQAEQKKENEMVFVHVFAVSIFSILLKQFGVLLPQIFAKTPPSPPETGRPETLTTF